MMTRAQQPQRHRPQPLLRPRLRLSQARDPSYMALLQLFVWQVAFLTNPRSPLAAVRVCGCGMELLRCCVE